MPNRAMKKTICFQLLAILWQGCERDRSITEKVRTVSKRKEARVQRRDSLKYVAGEQYFVANCAICHSTTQEAMEGPGLAGVTKRLTRQQFKRWIQNPMKLLEEGDSNAHKLYNEYNKTVMPPFPDVTDKQVDAVIYFIEEKGQKTGA